MGNENFTLIKDEKEIKKIFQSLVLTKGELICKGSKEFLCKLNPIFFQEDPCLIKASFTSTVRLENREPFLGYFFTEGEKYYFQGLAKVDENTMVVAQPAEVYRLQRRQRFRVKLPDKILGQFVINDLNGAAISLTGSLMDLGGQGCRASFPLSPTLKLDDVVKGQLSMGIKKPINLRGVVRHSRLLTNDKVSSQSVGFEFIELAQGTEDQLFALTLEIHKLMIQYGRPGFKPRLR